MIGWTTQNIITSSCFLVLRFVHVSNKHRGINEPIRLLCIVELYLTRKWPHWGFLPDTLFILPPAQMKTEARLTSLNRITQLISYWNLTRRCHLDGIVMKWHKYNRLYKAICRIELYKACVSTSLTLFNQVEMSNTDFHLRITRPGCFPLCFRLI